MIMTSECQENLKMIYKEPEDFFLSNFNWIESNKPRLS